MTKAPLPAAALGRTLSAGALCALLAACGAVPVSSDGASDARADAASDAHSDATLDATLDAPLDAAPDALPPADAAPDAPPPDAGPPLPTPIRNLVIIVKENHTFDNLFFDFPGVASRPPATARTSAGATINLATAHLPWGPTAADPVHTNYQAVNSWDHGRMDSFDQPDHPTVGNLPFSHYQQSDIPNYWAYAQHFVLCDNFFSTTLAPSSPGYISILAGHSPILDNPSCPAGVTCTPGICDTGSQWVVPRYNPRSICTAPANGPACLTTPTFVEHLPAGVTWRTYGGSPLSDFKSIHDSNALATHSRPMAQLLSDLQRGDMANVTVLVLWSGVASEHPPAHPCKGESQVVDIVNAVAAGGRWNESAILITYDDWGGWYDHVAPQVDACATAGVNRAFNVGFRLPLMILSPYARTGASGSGLVFHGQTEQASITRLVAELFHDPSGSPTFLTSLNPDARDGHAGSLLPAFDFTQAPRPPLMLTPRTAAQCPADPPTM